VRMRCVMTRAAKSQIFFLPFKPFISFVFDRFTYLHVKVPERLQHRSAIDCLIVACNKLFLCLVNILNVLHIFSGRVAKRLLLDGSNSTESGRIHICI